MYRFRIAILLAVLAVPQSAMASDACERLMAKGPVLRSMNEAAIAAHKSNPTDQNLEQIKLTLQTMILLKKGLELCLKINEMQTAGEVVT